jgi:hypothetical protein
MQCETRWTCLYKATLSQSDYIRVDNFPHDRHELTLHLGILAHRGIGQRWDRLRYPLALATEDDSQGSTRIPHGLLVDHVRIPDFLHDKTLQFAFVDVPVGSHASMYSNSIGRNFSSKKHTLPDRQLLVKVLVTRESAHYDRSIMPTLLLLNGLAVTSLIRNFDSATASTEIMLSIAFVEIGIRLSIDSHLPSVGYPIKMQRIMNQCFWMLCALVLESNLVFFLFHKRHWSMATIDRIDAVVGGVALLGTARIGYNYYYKK